VSLQLSDIINDVRFLHPAFDESRVPSKVLAAFLSNKQNELIGRAVERDKTYCAQQIALALAFDDANAPDVAGVGTLGGVPGTVSGSALSPDRAEAGRLVNLDASAVVAVAERSVTAATSTTTTSTGAGRGTNADVGKILEIVQGPGYGQQRKVTANTADTWTHAAWTTLPTDDSRMRVVAETLEADGERVVVTGLPSETERRGYLVRLDASGVAYIDYTKPLTLWVDRGAALPALKAVIGGTVRYADGERDALCITSYGRRHAPLWWPAVYLMGETLFLCGDETDWTDVESVELRYTPNAPAFAALTDYFLVPDAARPCLVAYGAAVAAEHAAARGIVIDVAMKKAEAVQAEATYLSTLRLSKRARVSTFREDVF